MGNTAIYQWVDDQGRMQYSQQKPHGKSLEPQKITIKTSRPADNKQLKSIQDSANEIARSNAARKAASDKALQETQEARLAQEKCATSKKNLSDLDYGGNRLYKGADGRYSRFTPEDKKQQREQLNSFINENCR